VRGASPVIETNHERRKQLAESGEPCGSPLYQCPGDRLAHLEYFNLSEDEKLLMMQEREISMRGAPPKAKENGGEK
jgi:hypothetical protein